MFPYLLRNLLLFFFLTPFSLFASDRFYPHYIAIIDAGSSGSRLHIYTYEKTDTLPILKETWSKKISPGITSLEKNTVSISSYFDKLFENAPVNDIPTYVYATAGMRLLPDNQQKSIQNLIKQWFDKNVQWPLIENKTITGKEEGIYGWLSVNYQLDNLQNNAPPIGVIDIGGASIQITLPIAQNTTVPSSEDIATITLPDFNTTLFTHSFIGLGQNEVAHQYMDTASCFIDNYKMPSGNKGLGDIEACISKITMLINQVHDVDSLIKPILSANPVSRWYGIGAIPFVASNALYEPQQSAFSNKALINKTLVDVCQQDFHALAANHSDNAYLFEYCLFPAYYYALMVNGYGIPANKKIHYIADNTANDWSLGAALMLIL